MIDFFFYTSRRHPSRVRHVHCWVSPNTSICSRWVSQDYHFSSMHKICRVFTPAMCADAVDAQMVITEATLHQIGHVTLPDSCRCYSRRALFGVRSNPSPAVGAPNTNNAGERGSEEDGMTEAFSIKRVHKTFLQRVGACSLHNALVNVSTVNYRFLCYV